MSSISQRAAILALAPALIIGLVAAAPASDHVMTASVTPRVSTSADPGVTGPYATARTTVFRGWERVEVDMPLRVEDLAEVTYPADAQGGVAAGTFPLVVLLHGRHSWCSTVGGEVPDPVPTWCADQGDIPVPSYRGYRYLADALASQGRIVLSVSANGVNAQDGSRGSAYRDLGSTARALLLEYHLHRLARAAVRSADGYGSLLVGHLDLSRTVLMGHSRGGEGVVRAAQLFAGPEPEPFAIAGVIPLAPVAYARMAPPVVPTVTILPACDGDVSDLQGETYLDRGRDLYGAKGALRSSVWLPGGNHNYFNTEWTPGLSVSETGVDDATYVYDEATGSCAADVRLTPGQVRLAGRHLMAAAVRYAQDGNVAMLRFFDGTGAQMRALAKSEITVRSASLAGPDRLLLVPQPDSRVTSTGARAELCRGVALSRDPAQPAVCATGAAAPSGDTSWLGSQFVPGGLPDRTAVDVAWSARGSALVDLQGTVDLSRSTRLSARIVLDPTSAGTVGLIVRDAEGRTASLPTAGLPVVPLTEGEIETRLWAQAAWVDPRRLRGVDLTRISAVGLTTEGSGRAWIIDVSHRGARPAGAALVLPTAEVEAHSVSVVDAGTTVTVPVVIRLDRPSTERARLRVAVAASFDDVIVPAWQSTVSVAPGTRRVTARVPVTMPEVVGAGAAASVQVAVYALSGATVGMFRGTLTVLPQGARVRTLEVVSADAAGVPGAAITWDFTADEPGKVSIRARVVGAMMDYSDLDPAFLESQWLPRSGPITPETWLTLQSTQVGPDRYQLALPLAQTARPGATIEFAVDAVQGAATRGIPNLTGAVS